MSQKLLHLINVGKLKWQIAASPSLCNKIFYFSVYRLVMDASEIEFLAENSPITIIPNFSEGVLYLVAGDVGPFAPGKEF